ncbi:MAG: hypothetical protein RPR97_12190 [Colwellia sp.]
MAVSAYGLPDEVIGVINIIISGFLFCQYSYFLFVYYKFESKNAEDILLFLKNGKAKCKENSFNVYIDCMNSIYGGLLQKPTDKPTKKLLVSKAKKGSRVDGRLVNGVYILSRGRFTIIPVFPIILMFYIGVLFF